MITWLVPGRVPAKSPAERPAEVTEGGAAIDVRLPTEASKKKVKVSPGEIVSGTVLTQNTDSTEVEAWPARNAVGLTLKTTFDPVCARPAAGSSNTRARGALTKTVSIAVAHLIRISSPFSWLEF